jgi:hypothetical protein
MVHRYGRFLRKTSNSKPAVNRVSQLRLRQVGISACIPAHETNIHIDSGNGMVQLDEGNWVIVKGNIG